MKMMMMMKNELFIFTYIYYCNIIYYCKFCPWNNPHPTGEQQEETHDGVGESIVHVYAKLEINA